MRSRLLRRFGPWLSQPHLWRMRRRTVAIGAAIGVFFAFIVPVGQIPLATAAALIVRANIPVACLATFINTPLTFGPVYYAAYLVGGLVLGDRTREDYVFGERLVAEAGWLTQFMSWVQDLGPALVVGTLLFSVVGSILTYFCVNTGWRLSVSARWRRRKAERI